MYKRIALGIFVCLFVASPAMSRLSPNNNTRHTRNFLAQHVNSVLKRKCLPQYSTTTGSLSVWIHRHTHAHQAKKGNCLPSPRAYAGYCLAWIIDHEDPGWNPRRFNSQGSGAYGLPQALPGSKMASAGADWATNSYTQIRWMRGYTTSTYGSPCAAKAFWEQHLSY